MSNNGPPRLKVVDFSHDMLLQGDFEFRKASVVVRIGVAGTKDATPWLELSREDCERLHFELEEWLARVRKEKKG